MLWEFTTHMELTKMQSSWKKKAKREKKLAEKRAKKQVKTGPVKIEKDKTIPIDQVITLDHLTNPDKK